MGDVPPRPHAPERLSDGGCESLRPVADVDPLHDIDTAGGAAPGIRDVECPVERDKAEIGPPLVADARPRRGRIGILEQLLARNAVPRYDPESALAILFSLALGVDVCRREEAFGVQILVVARFAAELPAVADTGVAIQFVGRYRQPGEERGDAVVAVRLELEPETVGPPVGETEEPEETGVFANRLSVTQVFQLRLA